MPLRPRSREKGDAHSFTMDENAAALKFIRREVWQGAWLEGVATSKYLFKTSLQPETHDPLNS
jgi:hypothetical protein